VICPKCVDTCRRQLGELVALHKLAGDAMVLLPGNSSRGSKSGERTIGLNTSALSFSQGAEIVGCLAAWKEWVWDEFNFADDLGDFQAPQSSSTHSVPTLVYFLQTHFEKVVTNLEVAEIFMAEIRELTQTGLAATGQIEQKQTRIKCPADYRDRLCNAVLQIDESDIDAVIQCKRCKTIWNLDWLYRVRLAIPNSQYWLDAESIAQYLKITPRKVRYWAAKWDIPRWGPLYEIRKFVEKHDQQEKALAPAKSLIERRRNESKN
jgi:hypothetical protein